MILERRLFVTTREPGALLADARTERGAFVPTRAPLAKGERVLLDVRADDEGLRCELPVVVAERRQRRVGRGGLDVGVVVKVVGQA